jgi:uncharacterized membrane protein (DUF4010 family)
MEEEISKSIGFSLDLLIAFGVSIGIGFLIGLERQFSKQVKEKEEQFAGVRTFTMISIFGFLSAFLASKFGAWIFAVALVGVFALVIVSYFQISKTPGNKGGTTEVAALITFLLGAIVFLQLILFALVVMVVILFLLAYKPSLHQFVNKLTKEELLAIIQFVLIAGIILPFLPDKNFGPYDLWNLRNIWKMVALVSGTSLVGYMVAKLIGQKGTLIAGILGGLVSSTSVALTFSRRSKQSSSSSGTLYLAIGILAACTIMFPRILFEVYVVNAGLAQQLWLPILLVTAAGFVTAFFIYRRKKSGANGEELVLKNPLNFGTAIKFAMLYAGIQWLVKFSNEKFGSGGTYIAGAVSGFTDVDAITLSMARMSTGDENAALAINTIMLAALSNTLVKFIIVLVVGSMDLRKICILGFGSLFVVGLAYFIYRMLA